MFKKINKLLEIGFLRDDKGAPSQMRLICLSLLRIFAILILVIMPGLIITLFQLGADNALLFVAFGGISFIAIIILFFIVYGKNAAKKIESTGLVELAQAGIDLMSDKKEEE